jgi:hypothetical protein
LGRCHSSGWPAAERSKRSGDDSGAGRALAEVLSTSFSLLPDREELNTLWQELVERHVVMGIRAHDVRLVAAMQSDGITQLLTFNASDFHDLGIVILNPAAV